MSKRPIKHGEFSIVCEVASAAVGYDRLWWGRNHGFITKALCDLHCGRCRRDEKDANEQTRKSRNGCHKHLSHSATRTKQSEGAHESSSQLQSQSPT